jgi:HEAT repeat protein
MVVRAPSEDHQVLDAVMSEMNLVERLEKAAPHLAEDEAAMAREYVENLRGRGILSFPQLVETVSDPRASLSVRLSGCRLLAWLGDRSASIALERALENGENEGLVWEAAKALAYLRPDQAVPTLLRLLERGSSVKQAAAAWALGWLRATPAIPSLRAAAANLGFPDEVRAHATEALGVMGAKEAVEDLVALLSNESPEIRYWAAYSLGQIGAPESIPALERVASSDTGVRHNGESVRKEALEALDAIRSKGATS